MVVHNENFDRRDQPDSPDLARPLTAPSTPALLLVDTISSLGSIEYEHDAWGVDVTVSCSQKD